MLCEPCQRLCIHESGKAINLSVPLTQMQNILPCLISHMASGAELCRNSRRGLLLSPELEAQHGHFSACLAA